MEEISNKGNGNYFYIDSAKESTRVLCQKINSTLVTIAKDVKIQVEFNPSLVHSYRLIGYDNRKLRDEDFNNDKIDAGEIGAGHSVTAIYEIVPVGAPGARAKVDQLKYQTNSEEALSEKPVGEFRNEVLTVKLRYKSPEGGPSTLMSYPLKNESVKYSEASKSFVFASSVAAFGMIMKNSEYAGEATIRKVQEWIHESEATQNDDEKKAFLKILKQAQGLMKGE